jgi:predicted secreted protein/N-acetylneuraminic acid mutarotase
MPSARCYHATCTFDGKIYVFGGTPGVWSFSVNKNVYVYDPQIDSWTQKADMPYVNGWCCIAVVDGTIYLIGGTPSESSPAVSTVMAYNPITESWMQKADMPTARANLSACVLDGKIYAIGGAEDWRVSSYKQMEVYDPATNTWTRKSDMPTQRWGLGTCVVNGKIFAIGGSTVYAASNTANEVYNPITDTWTTKSPMQQKRYGLFVGSIGDKIYAIGGSVPPMLSTVEEYDTGFGVPSPDFNGDGIVDSADMCIMVDHWGEDYSLCDIGPTPLGDGVVDVQDLIVLAEHLFEVYPSAETVEVNEDNDGGLIELELGKLLVVTLESNPSTGYRWELLEDNESILKQFGQAEFKSPETSEPPMVGAGGWEIFRFKAVSAGQMTLELVYHRSWEDVEPLKTFSIQVVVR